MIKLIRSAQELKAFKLAHQGSLGFVPTMGNLHDGHLSLLKKSFQENDHTVLSIFVNPKQFAPGEDFLKYPRTLDEDIKKVSRLNHDCWIFNPQVIEDIYPSNFSTSIRNESLGLILEGSVRPNHFEGVLTVVYRLFQIVQPTNTYFGLKDYQQYTVIKRMAHDLSLPLHVWGMPIIRDENGLALSSRNQYLSASERQEALAISKTIAIIKDLLSTTKDIKLARAEADLIVKKDSRWNYLEIRDSETLGLEIENKHVVILGAMKIGQTRLIDNTIMEVP